MSYFRDISEAVVSGKIEDIQKFIRDGADVNKRDCSCRIPLDYCLVISPTPLNSWVSGSSCCGKRKGIGVAERTDQAISFCTYCQKRLEKAKFLLEKGTDPNNTDRFGWTIVHQCAWNGDLPLLRLCVQKGAKVGIRTKDERLPVQMAATRGYTDIVRYLDSQSCDLKSLCRLEINAALGKSSFNRIKELPIPPTIKLFLNYNIPYTGFEATLIPPQPWSAKELHKQNVSAEDIHQFICENASQEFLVEHKDIIGDLPTENTLSAAKPKCNGAGKQTTGKITRDLKELIEVFQSMYLWEAFKSVEFEEPLPRKPRYSMEKLEKEDKERGEAANTGFNYRSFLKQLYTNAY